MLKAFVSTAVFALICPSLHACQGVPANVYAFFRDHLEFRVRIQKLSQKDALDLASKYAKYLGMTLEESAGDASKVARHGKERVKGNYSENKDWTAGRDIKASLAEISRNIDRFVPNADHQINFGILQLSPDMAAYGDTPHEFVRSSLKQLQSMAKNPKQHRMLLDHCGSRHLISASPQQILAEFSKLGDCNPVLSTKVVKVSSKSKKTTTVPVYNKQRMQCFAKLAMLCPGLGLQIIGRYPRAHWGSAGASPKCTSELKAHAASLFGSGSKKKSH